MKISIVWSVVALAEADGEKASPVTLTIYVVCPDFAVRVRGDVQLAVRGAVHAAQRDSVRRHAGGACARAGRAHQAA